MTAAEPSNFEGHQPRECGEHRTVGPHRAWCHDCQEWCYPDGPCVRCEILRLRAIEKRALELAEAGREDGCAKPYRHAARYILGETA